MIEAAYRVEMPEPRTQRLLVHVDVANAEESEVLLSLPRWAPGWYVLREYARNVEEIAAVTPRGRALDVEKSAVCTWRVRNGRSRTFTVTLRIYAAKWGDAYSHVDHEHASLFGPSIFPWVHGAEDRPTELILDVPEHWGQLSTGLPTVADDPRRRRAEDYDHLIDCPIEAGNHEAWEFEVHRIPHELAIVGGPIAEDPERIVGDLAKIVTTTAKMFDELPYDRYVFLLYVTPRPTGSLEHRNSTTLTMLPRCFEEESWYVNRFLTTAAHEFFHAYNVKRIRPADLVPVDYSRIQHSTMMWIFEGLTSYFDDRIVRRAGLMGEKDYLKKIAKNVTTHRTTPGRVRESLVQSSFDAWVKFMVKDENWKNRGISFYTKGLLVGLCLDVEIRERSGGDATLADVMRAAYAESRRPGYQGLTLTRFRRLAEIAAGGPLPEIFDRYLDTTEELDLDGHLERLGLALKEDWGKRERLEPEPRKEGWLGFETKTREGRILVTRVPLDTPALRGGLAYEDEILFVEDRRVESEEALTRRIRHAEPGVPLRLTVSRHGLRRDLVLTPETPPARKWKLERAPKPSRRQERLYRRWIR